MAGGIGCPFAMLCGYVSEKDTDVRREEREYLLSACCLRNFSLAPEPPGVLEGIAVSCFMYSLGLAVRSQRNLEDLTSS